MSTLLFLLPLALPAIAQSGVDYSQHVNVFSGSDNNGRMFPGVTAEPFASAKIGPDCALGNADAYVGYLDDANAFITGFSMMHESGIGGSPKYGVVSQMPVPGDLMNPLVDLSSKRTQPDQGSIGYYKTQLQNGVTVELAGTAHAGLFQYTFPAGKTSNVVMDVSHFLPSYRKMNWEQHYKGGAFKIASDGHYEGSGIYDGGWNYSPAWTIYFCGHFDQPALSQKTFQGSNQSIGSYGSHDSVSGTDRLGGVYSFNTTKVTSRVGVSFVSAAKACSYVNAEIPSGTALSQLVSQAKAKWNHEVLSKITTTETNNQTLEMLYSSMYGMYLLPSNRTGDNPNWQSSEPYYDDIFTFWDTFRCHTSLMHVLQPTAYSELLRSVIDIWRNVGWTPDARSSNHNGKTQGGSNSDNVLADAYVKGVKGINWNDAYSAMLTNAEKTPPNSFDPMAQDSSTVQGRGALPDWLKYGYITPKYTRAVSRAVEYAGNDFALSQVAMGLGKSADEHKYLQRSRQWRNHWNANASALGTNGFLVPRLANGDYIEQNPVSCDGCYWSAPYYEGKPWEYTVNAHHDMAVLVEMGGGNASFVQRLNTLMDPAHKIFDAGNEPSFTSPYLYNFVNRQDLSVDRSRTVAKKYKTGPAALPGASDAGAMQSWLLWNMIGLYPLTGQTTFLIGSPWLTNMNITTPGGKTLSITSTGGNSDTAYYVQSLAVNGVTWTKNWLTWDDLFANGGTMVFELGPKPVHWDTGDVPPSPASAKRDAQDNGLPAHAQPDGTTVAAPQPDQGRRMLKAAIATVSAVGSVGLISGVIFILWFRKKGIFGRKQNKCPERQLSESGVKWTHDSPVHAGTQREAGQEASTSDSEDERKNDVVVQSSSLGGANGELQKPVKIHGNLGGRIKHLWRRGS